jgi:hypothetical protein
MKRMNIIYLLIAIVLLMAIMRMGQAPVRAQADVDQTTIKGIDISTTAF